MKSKAWFAHKNGRKWKPTESAKAPQRLACGRDRNKQKQEEEERTHKEEWEGRTGDAAQWSESRISNPNTLGSIPWRVRVTEQFFYPSESSLVQTSLCLTPPSWVRHAPKFVLTLSICLKRIGLSRWYGNTNRLHTGKKQSWVPVAPYYGCSFSPGKAAQISRALQLGHESYLI